MFEIKQNIRDREAEDKGAWMEFGGGRFCVARINNSRYKGHIQKQYQSNKAAISRDDFEAFALADKITAEGIAKYILLDWENITDNGKAVEYNSKLALEILEEHDDLREAIEDFSRNRENYLVKSEEETAEDLKK